MFGLGVHLDESHKARLSRTIEHGEILYSTDPHVLVSNETQYSVTQTTLDDYDDDDDTSDEATPTQLSIRQFPGPAPETLGTSIPMRRDQERQPLDIEYSINFDPYGSAQMFVDSSVPLCPHSHSDFYDRIVPLLLNIMAMIVNTIDGWEVAPQNPLLLHAIQRRWANNSRHQFLGVALKRPKPRQMPADLLQLLSSTFHDERLFRAKRHPESDQLVVEAESPLFTGYFHLHQMLYPGCFSVREEKVRGNEVAIRKSRFIPPHRWFASQPESIVEGFGRGYWNKLKEASQQTIGEMWEYAEGEEIDVVPGVEVIEVHESEQERREPLVAVRAGEDDDNMEMGVFMRELNEIMGEMDLTEMGRPLLG